MSHVKDIVAYSKPTSTVSFRRPAFFGTVCSSTNLIQGPLGTSGSILCIDRERTFLASYYKLGKQCWIICVVSTVSRWTQLCGKPEIVACSVSWVCMCLV